jgi:osmotically-inducible protein OsmY
MPTSTEKVHSTGTDAEIARDLSRRMKGDFEVPDNRIRIKVEDGFVTLEGTVDRNSQKVAAEKCAGRVEGILGINNIIKVTVPEIRPEDW